MSRYLDDQGTVTPLRPKQLELLEALELELGASIEQNHMRAIERREKKRRIARITGGVVLAAVVATGLAEAASLFVDATKKLANSFYAIPTGGTRLVMSSRESNLVDQIELDGFSAINLHFDESTNSSTAEFDQLIDNCDVPMQVQAQEMLSQAGSPTHSANRYTLLLNQQPSEYSFADYADFARALGPNICTRVAELSDGSSS